MSISVIELLHPRWWIMLGKYNRAWDSELNSLLDNFSFEPVHYVLPREHLKDTWIDIYGEESWLDAKKPSEFQAKLDDVTIWVENYPYGAFYCPSHKGSRPSRRTILRAWKKYQKDKENWGEH